MNTVKAWQAEVLPGVPHLCQTQTHCVADKDNRLDWASQQIGHPIRSKRSRQQFTKLNISLDVLFAGAFPSRSFIASQVTVRIRELTASADWGFMHRLFMWWNQIGLWCNLFNALSLLLSTLYSQKPSCKARWDMLFKKKKKFKKSNYFAPFSGICCDFCKMTVNNRDSLPGEWIIWKWST